MDQRAERHRDVLPPHARPGRRAQQGDGRSGALGVVEYSRHGDGASGKLPHGADLPDGSHQISATGPQYRGRGAPATAPQHHYTFEIYALDTKLDVVATADAFETRNNVMKAIQ